MEKWTANSGSTRLTATFCRNHHTINVNSYKINHTSVSAFTVALHSTNDHYEHYYPNTTSFCTTPNIWLP